MSLSFFASSFFPFPSPRLPVSPTSSDCARGPTLISILSTILAAVRAAAPLPPVSLPPPPPPVDSPARVYSKNPAPFSPFKRPPPESPPPSPGWGEGGGLLKDLLPSDGESDGESDGGEGGRDGGGDGGGPAASGSEARRRRKKGAGGREANGGGGGEGGGGFDEGFDDDDEEGFDDDDDDDDDDEDAGTAPNTAPKPKSTKPQKLKLPRCNNPSTIPFFLRLIAPILASRNLILSFDSAHHLCTSAPGLISLLPLLPTLSHPPRTITTVLTTTHTHLLSTPLTTNPDSLGTISSTSFPLVVTFPAYTPTQIRDIVLLPRVRSAVLEQLGPEGGRGGEVEEEGRGKVYGCTVGALMNVIER